MTEMVDNSWHCPEHHTDPLKTLEEHGWNKVFPVDLLDSEGPDLELAIPEGKVIQKNFVGKDLKNYDSMLVLSHFKGHPMGG